MGVHQIVVVGANFSGLGTAHYLLKHTIPALEKAKNGSTTYKLTLISPSTHFYYKFGLPRVLASPDLIPISKAVLPIAEGFKDYPEDHFELVIGKATALDEGKKSLTVEGTYEPIETRNVSYDTLVLATGASSASPIWDLKGSHEISVAALKEMHAALPKASSILIAGGGPAGVETAGEIGTLYPKAKTIILSGSDRLLTRLRPAISDQAESQLSGLGVKVVHDVKVNSATKKGSKTVLELSDNTTNEFDIYIDATGPRPNTTFLPKGWLDEREHVKTESKETLRGPIDGVYAIGDCAGYALGSIFDILDAVRPLCGTIYSDLAGPGSNFKAPLFKQNLKETQLVPIGPNGGVGAAYGWKLPSFAIRMIKGKDFMIGKAPDNVFGKEYVKA
ncbi:MAG: hypothetical protein LQ342_002784 [Letrouitia transgressa]|nr:MAG: hypothetical protein LQ342_002784 [Letrouitia transgressa]